MPDNAEIYGSCRKLSPSSGTIHPDQTGHTTGNTIASVRKEKFAIVISAIVPAIYILYTKVFQLASYQLMKICVPVIITTGCKCLPCNCTYVQTGVTHFSADFIVTCTYAWPHPGHNMFSFAENISIVFAMMFLLNPLQPTCTAATFVPCASHSNKGRQSAVSTTHTVFA
jgi:hypothetical protein